MQEQEWIERPYGRKKVLSEKSQILQIDPDKHTGMGVRPEELDKNGLRGHPGALFEYVEHKGYAGSNRPEINNYSLLYKFRARDLNQVFEQYFGKGARFYSVQMDAEKTGYWHIMKNISDFPILLKIDLEKAS